MKTSHLLSIQRRGTRYVIIATSPLLVRGEGGKPVLTRSPWASSPRPRIVGRPFASECEAAYALGALEQRLALADR
jgi:hypothetical protein